MYTLQESEDFAQSGTPMISQTGFIRFEGVRKQLPISDLFEIYITQTLVAKRQANPRTKRNNVLRMEQILKNYGIDPADSDISAFASVTGAGIPICDDWVARRGSNEMRQARSIFSKAWIKR